MSILFINVVIMNVVYISVIQREFTSQANPDVNTWDLSIPMRGKMLKQNTKIFLLGRLMYEGSPLSLSEVKPDVIVVTFDTK